MKQMSACQFLDVDAPHLDPNSTVALGSAGKFITHIAALQLVERGLVSLDEPLCNHIPELDSFPLITRGLHGEPFPLRPPTKKITLRHLLLHTSGLSDPSYPLVAEYFASGAPKLQIGDDAPYIVKTFSIPLIFEPGEGFQYGCSIHWTQLLVTRLSGNFTKHIHEHIFDPLGMEASTYTSRNRADIWESRLRMVEREGDTLIAADDVSQGLMCSMLDIGVILSDLISASSKLLRQESIDLLFVPQLAPSTAALDALRADHENYAFMARIPGSVGPPSVNWSAAGLVVEEELPLSRLPKGAVTWEGMANVIWAMNRDKGLGMCFATQLIPVEDEKAKELSVTFMREAWNMFG